MIQIYFPHLSRVLAVPLIIVAVLVIVGPYNEDGFLDLNLLILSVMGLFLLYVFNKQIDHWWWRKRLPLLDPKIKLWLSKFSPYYRGLRGEDINLFDRRISQFTRIKNFTFKGKRDYEVQEDIKTMVAHEFIRIGLKRDDYLLDHYQHIVLYGHPFASPQYRFLHTFELHFEDGVIILSRQQLVNGFNAANHHFNLGLYAAVSAFISVHPQLNYPTLTDLTEETIATRLDLDLSLVKATLGFDWVNTLNILIYCYFERSQLFIAVFPEEASILGKIFNPDKSNG